MKETADEEAIRVFSQNLRELLLSPPAGQRVVMGIDPGFRTGCKVAVVDATGKFLEHATIYPTPPHNKTAEAAAILLKLVGPAPGGVDRHRHGHGIAGDRRLRGLDARLSGSKLAKVSVNESGASIYSASDVARAEFPDLDLTVRGAISIARRLQDPLAELVKIDPKSIGVGQYQHDVNQAKLRKALDREVESCVNLVGVDLNTASVQLLSYVSGIGPKLAEGILQHRNVHGAFSGREDLLSVPRLGSKAFQQSAGFLRVRGGRQPLDNSAVHPESYPIVEKMAEAVGVTPESLIGNAAVKQARSAAIRGRAGRAAHRRRHPPRAGEARPRSAPRVPRAEVRRRGPRAGRPARGDDPRRGRHQRHPIRRVCRRRGPPGRPDPHLRVGPPVRQGSCGSGGRGGHRPRESPPSRRPARPDLSVAKTGCGLKPDAGRRPRRSQGNPRPFQGFSFTRGPRAVCCRSDPLPGFATPTPNAMRRDWPHRPQEN